MRIMLGTSPAEDSVATVGGQPPMGVLYVAASVSQLPQVEVRMLDGLAEGLTQEQATERVIDYSPDILGISVLSSTFQRGLRLLRRVKAARPGTLTALGGPHATLFDRLLLREAPEVDMIFRGEGERSFAEFCRRLLRQEDTAGVPGLSYRSKGHIIRGKAQGIHHLDSLPFPARNVLKYDGYFQRFLGWPVPLSHRTTSLLSSRGCPNHCTFCSRHIPGMGKFRVRSAENVFQELVQISAEGYDMVWFLDDNFTADVARVHKLCRMILDHKLGLRFGFGGTLHQLSESTLKLMKRAGFELVFVGVESGCDAQLKRFNKASGSLQMEEGVARAKRAHIFVVANFITGGPGETRADAEATEKFVRRTRPHFAETGILKVYPGSPLWRKMTGTGEPATLEGSSPRWVYEFPGQTDKETLQKRERSFRRSFARTWLHWRRPIDLFNLVLHSRTSRSALAALFRRPGRLFSTIRPLFR